MSVVTFTVMSLNVLSDENATKQKYGYCPSWALNWDYRKSAILKEIQMASPDIIALQVCHSTSITTARSQLNASEEKL